MTGAGSSAPMPVFRRLVDGGLLYDAQRDCIHHLNETAAVICEAWRNGDSEAAIVAALTARYEVADDVARAHVRDVLRRLAGAPPS